MKKTILNFLYAGAALMLLFSACSKDDDLGDPATFTDLSVNADNTVATLTFNVAVYATSNRSGALTNESFTVSITGGTASLGSFDVVHDAGSTQVRLNLILIGAADGTEVLTVSTASGSSIYNAGGTAMASGVSTTANLNETGIIGRWQSSGDDVALLLRNAGIDSIFADFRADNTYLVESFQADGSRTELRGTFGQQKSNTGNIYTITITQNTPTSLISEGIFEVTVDGTVTTMNYEIAQTDPGIPGVTPPTPAGGFGSTSGGAFGVANVQRYKKL